MLLGAVGTGVTERRVDASPGRAGVAAGRVQLRDERHVGARVVRFDGGAHARAAGPDNQYDVRVLRHGKTVHNPESFSRP